MQNRTLSFVFSVLIAVSACADIPKATPVVLDPLLTKLDQQIPWLTQYKLSRAGEHPDDCGTLAALSHQTHFVLRDLALLRAYEICSDPKLLESLPTNLVEDSPWLTRTWTRTQLALANRTQNQQQLVTAEIAIAKQSLRNREKLEWLQKASEHWQEGLTPTRDEIFAMQTRVAPRLKINPKAQDWIPVGLDFILARDFTKGRSYLKKVLQQKNSSTEDHYMALRYWRNSFKLAQEKEAHIAAAKDLLVWVQQQKDLGQRASRLHEAYITLARAEWTQGQAQDAENLLAKARRALRRMKITGQPIAELEWLQARIEEERGHFKSALTHLNLAADQVREKSIWKTRIDFHQGWILRKMNRFTEAAEHFQEMTDSADDPLSQYRYQFWQAQSLKQAGQVQAATALLNQIRERDVMGYYGLLAHDQLGLPLPPMQSQTLILDDRAKLTQPSSKYQLEPEVQLMIRSLVLAGEKEILDRYISLGPLDLKTSGPQNSSTWLFVLQNLAEAGLYQPLFAQLGSLSPELKSQILRENPQLIFPRPYLEILQPWSEKMGVEAELALAIMRQESSFDPFARSTADAFGLMQLLPSAAQAQEDLTGIRIENHEDLYRPEINIPLGSALLSRLWKKYQGRLILTAAAYNASETAIANWVHTRMKNDTLEFIEDIPYEETRNYVKLVMRNYVFYKRLSQPQQPMAFPHQCLEVLASAIQQAPAPSRAGP